MTAQQEPSRHRVAPASSTPALDPNDPCNAPATLPTHLAQRGLQRRLLLLMQAMPAQPGARQSSVAVTVLAPRTAARHRRRPQGGVAAHLLAPLLLAVRPAAAAAADAAGVGGRVAAAAAAVGRAAAAGEEAAAVVGGQQGRRHADAVLGGGLAHALAAVQGGAVVLGVLASLPHGALLAAAGGSGGFQKRRGKGGLRQSAGAHAAPARGAAAMQSPSSALLFYGVRQFPGHQPPRALAPLAQLLGSQPGHAAPVGLLLVAEHLAQRDHLVVQLVAGGEGGGLSLVIGVR
jgi:hypothetical protein